MFVACCHNRSVILAAFRAGAGYNTGSIPISGGLGGPTGPRLQQAQAPGGGSFSSNPINSGGSPQESTEQPGPGNTGTPRANEVCQAWLVLDWVPPVLVAVSVGML